MKLFSSEKKKKKTKGKSEKKDKSDKKKKSDKRDKSPRVRKSERGKAFHMGADVMEFFNNACINEYKSLKVDIVISFNTCLTGFLAEIPYTELGDSSQEEFDARLTSGNNYKYLMSCKYRMSPGNSCLADFCHPMMPVTVCHPCDACPM